MEVKPIAFPFYDRVIIKRDIQEEKRTASGLYIPETVSKKPNTGVVMAIGPGTKDIPSTVPVGSKVLFSAYAGSPITLDDGIEYLLMKEDDIFCIL